MNEVLCCVCGRKLAVEARADADQLYRIGKRHFCSEHYQRAMQAGKADWSRAGVIEVVLVTAFVALVGWSLGSGEGATLPTSLGTGLVLSLVPALIWMAYIYRRDRIEPEPWGVVLGVFIAGGLLSHATAAPLAQHLFRIDDWQHQSSLASWVASVAVVGALEQLCTYLAVRYTVYLTDEFDEPMDGLVYATAAGLGVATVLSVDFVVRSQGVLPLAGATTIASTALVHVAAAAVLGYGMGYARFSGPGGQRVLLGCFLLSVLANGGLKRLALVAGVSGGVFQPWSALVVAAGVAALILLGIDRLCARLARTNFQEAPLAST